MLCYFANRFPPFVESFLQSGGKLRRRFREETITDLMMSSLLSLGGGNVIVEFPDEPVTGADMQWDFVNRDRGTFFRILIQAKRLYDKTSHWSRHSYQELFHLSGSSGMLQAKVLCDTARSQAATYPLYAFYHPGQSCTLARNDGIAHIEGVNLANGYLIEKLALSATSQRLRTRTKRLGTLNPFFFSMRSLFCPPLLDPLGPMAFHPPRGFEMPLVLSFEFSRPILGMPLPPRPEDVHQRLSDQHRSLGEIFKPIDPNFLLPEMPPVSSSIPDDVLANIEQYRAGASHLEKRRLPYWRVTFVSAEPRVIPGREGA